jgi:colanic acid/amylovoran biosynthesis protein
LSFRSSIHFLLLYLFWFAARLTIRPRPKTTDGDSPVWLVSCDVVTLVGSRGDEAMTEAVLGRIRDLWPGARVQVAVASPEAAEAAQALGCDTFHVWGGPLMPFRLSALLRRTKPVAGFMIGADIMDGLYSPVEALRRIIAADLLARTGAASAFTGFSMNEEPSPWFRPAFRMVDRRVHLNLRDPLSHQRFEAFTGGRARAVADVAFLLKPGGVIDACQPTVQWVRQQQTSGRCVIAMNFHPMLFEPSARDTAVARLEQALSACMTKATESQPVSWLLLPHDDRKHIGDVAPLVDLHAALPASVRDHVHLLRSPPPAAAIKELAGMCDGVITGRMHLAIAALGGGVPVLALAYQAKFAGLMQWFQLPDWLLLDPVKVSDEAILWPSVQRFVAERAALRDTVLARLPDVKRAAHANFEA